MKNLLLLVLLLSIGAVVIAQKTFPRNGVADSRDGLYAFTNATIYKTYDQKLEKATLLIKDGKILEVGQAVNVPQDAVVIDTDGKTIYPSFIDLFSNYGMPEPKAEGQRPKQSPQMLSNKKGAYSWNEALRPEFNSVEHFKVDKKATPAYRKQGFGTVLIHKMDGISRGTSTLVLEY